MTPITLRGTKNPDNFILGEKGFAFGSLASAGQDDDAIILDFTAGQDVISLAGRSDDYLLRPTSLPFSVSGYRQYSPAIAIFLTDRTARTKQNPAGGAVEGNEITPIGWIVQPSSSQLSFDDWMKSLGLTLDTATNKPIDDYRKRLQQLRGGEFTPSNYLADTSGKILSFDGSSAPKQSAEGGRKSTVYKETLPTIQGYELQAISQNSAGETFCAYANSYRTKVTCLSNGKIKWQQDIPFGGSGWGFTQLVPSSNGSLLFITSTSEVDAQQRGNSNLQFYIFSPTGANTAKFEASGNGSEMIWSQTEISKEGIAWVTMLTDSSFSLDSNNYNQRAPIKGADWTQGQDVLVARINVNTGEKRIYRIGTESADRCFGGALNEDTGTYTLSMISQTGTPSLNGTALEFEKPFTEAPKYDTKFKQYFVPLNSSKGEKSFFFNRVDSSNAERFADATAGAGTKCRFFAVQNGKSEEFAVFNDPAKSLAPFDKYTYEESINSFVVDSISHSKEYLKRVAAAGHGSIEAIKAAATEYSSSLSTKAKLCLFGTPYEFKNPPTITADSQGNLLLSGILKNEESLGVQAVQVSLGLFDDVALPSITLAVAPAAVLENGSQNLIYTFTRTGPTNNSLTVNYSVGGTARLAASGSDAADFSIVGSTSTATSRTVIFAAGSSTATVTVDPTADTTVETDETVALTLAAGTGYTIGTINSVVGTITNDDVAPAVPTISSIGGTDKIVSSAANDNRVIGTAAVGSTVTLRSGSNTLGTAVANSSGAFSYELTAANLTTLGQGTGKSVTATASDSVGNTSAATAAFTFAVRTVAPSDPITGFSLTSDENIRITSDTVYNRNSQIGALMGNGGNVQDWQTEFEFGSRDFIVYTETFRAGDGSRVSNRSTIEGEFQYSNGKLSSANVKRLAIDSRSTGQDGKTFQSGSIQNIGSQSISNPNSIRGWGQFISSFSAVPYQQINAEAKYQKYTLSGAAESSVGDQESAIRSYQQGRFFADKWWDIPFASNLI